MDGSVGHGERVSKALAEWLESPCLHLFASIALMRQALAAPYRHAPIEAMTALCSRPRRSMQTLAARRGARDNGGMNILLNGEARTFAAPIPLNELLQAEGLGERRVAVEINGEIVPRGQHAHTVLAEGDKVEIVHALGGG